ncbi:MAG: hypothetical protein JJU45_09360 [Acidimicrobiia bacterium]|nr:hypothetical protein [Acidimicrobiia bacterium]
MPKRAEVHDIDDATRPPLEWRSKRKLTVGSTTFACVGEHQVRGKFDVQLQRAKKFATQHLALLESTPPGATVVSLGVVDWGTTVLTTRYGAVRHHVALEAAPDRQSELDQYVSEHQLEPVLRPHFGVDLTDRSKLQDLLYEELGSDLIDLVVDEQTQAQFDLQASFDAIFPLMRPGGRYVLQQWRRQVDVIARLQEAAPIRSPNNAALAATRPREAAIAVLTGPDPDEADAMLQRFERLLVAGGDVGSTLDRQIRAALPELRSQTGDGTHAVVDRLEAMLDPAQRSASPAAKEEQLAARGVLGIIDDGSTGESTDAIPAPITCFGLAVALAHTARPDVIASVQFDEWLTIERGRALLDPETFSLAELHHGDPTEMAAIFKL